MIISIYIIYLCVIYHYLYLQCGIARCPNFLKMKLPVHSLHFGLWTHLPNAHSFSLSALNCAERAQFEREVKFAIVLKQRAQ